MYKDIERYADILAIPFWIIAVLYFLKIKNKTRIEYLLTFFVVMGLICDTYFSLSFFKIVP